MNETGTTSSTSFDRAIDTTHSFFYYPATYKPKNKICDSYAVTGTGHKLLFLSAKEIMLLSFFAALASIIVLGVLFYRTIREEL